MSSIAQGKASFYAVAHAFDDRKIDTKETAQILDAIFDEEGHVNADVYSYFQSRFDNQIICFSGQDSSLNRHCLTLLRSSFPGDRIHFEMMLAKQGVPLPSIPASLPEISLQSYYTDKSGFHVDCIVAGGEHLIDIGPQGKKTLGELEKAIVTDCLKLLDEPTTPYLNDRNPDAAQFYQHLSPYPLKNNPANTTETDDRSLLPSSLQKVKMNQHHAIAEWSSIPVYTNYMDARDTLEDAIRDLTNILGPSWVDFFEENGVSLNLIDFHLQSDRIQQQQKKGSLDIFQESAGYYDPISRQIFADITLPREEFLCVLVHELGHALNYIVQSQQHTVFVSALHEMGLDISGAQRLAFNSNMGVNQAPSIYATTNFVEFFAEWFMVMTLERSGRLNLMKQISSINPLATQTPFLIDPENYLLMHKIIDSVEHREEDPDTFALLMENGITFSLMEGVGLFSNRQDIRALSTTIEQKPEALSSVLEHWDTYSLKELYDTPCNSPTPEDQLRAAFSAPPKKWKDIWILPNYPDLFAVVLKKAFQEARTDTAKINSLMKYGFTSSQRIHRFIESLLVLDKRDVNQILQLDYYAHLMDLQMSQNLPDE